MLAESMRRISGLLQAGRYAEAHAQLATVVTGNPDYVEGLRLLAGTKQVLGEPGHAEALLRRALEIDPLWTPTLTTLAELLLAAGRGAEAVPLLQRAVQGSPAYPRAALLFSSSMEPPTSITSSAPRLGQQPHGNDDAALRPPRRATGGFESCRRAAMATTEPRCSLDALRKSNLSAGESMRAPPRRADTGSLGDAMGCRLRVGSTTETPRDPAFSRHWTGSCP